MRTGATIRVHGVDHAAVTAAIGLGSTSPADETWRLTIEPTDDTDLHVSIQTLLDAPNDVHGGLRRLNVEIRDDAEIGWYDVGDLRFDPTTRPTNR